MSVYAIAQGRVTKQNEFEQYLQLAGPTLEAHNVGLLSIDEEPVAVEGENEFPRTVILEFRDREHFYNWYNSPEYQTAREHRLTASVGRFFLVNGI
jgi:uncharacterized protein (DUF1330 family)